MPPLFFSWSSLFLVALFLSMAQLARLALVYVTIESLAFLFGGCPWLNAFRRCDSCDGTFLLGWSGTSSPFAVLGQPRPCWVFC